MVRRATVPPRTIFTKDVGKITRDPGQARKKIEKIKLADLKFDEVKYIYTNNISEVDKNVVDKYNISDNFEKFYDLIVDGIIIYSIYIKR